MPSKEKQLVEFIARIVYNIPGLSSDLKFYFNQYITFHYQGKLSINQIHDIENRKASKDFKDEKEIVDSSAPLLVEEKVWIIASLQLLQSEAESLDDRIISRRINKRTKELTTILNLDNEPVKILEERNRIEAEIQGYQNRPIIKIPASILPLTIDYFLRWILLLTFSYQAKDLNSLIPLNMLLPFLIFFMGYWIARIHKKNNEKLLEQYGGAHRFKITYEIGANQYTWLAIFLGSSIFIRHLVSEPQHIWPMIIAFALYYLLFLRTLRIGRLSENDLVRQLEKENLDTSKLSVDQNDEVIVQIETKLNSATGRLEAYVLESALFGALSFSGFLQIMASELINFKDLENFASSIYNSAKAFIHFDWERLKSGIEVLSSKESLFCLISVESLVCSIFFLAVIASRLRFSDIGDRVRTAINMSKAYNEKEEALHEDSDPSEKKAVRLQEMTTKVNDQLHTANRVMDEIIPVMNYMVYFRNAGIIVFVIILVSSSLFIAGALSWIFIGLIVATILYFNRSWLNRKYKALSISARIEFVKKGYWLIGFAILPIALAYVLRIFLHIRTTDFLFSIGEILIGLYIFLWLLLAAHVDEKFGEIEMKQSKQTVWRIVKIIVAALIFIMSLSMAFYDSFLGAREMILLCLIGLSFTMYFIGYYLTKKWWLGLLCGGILGTLSLMGIVFKELHLAGANEMISTVFYAYLILIPIVYFKGELFHRLFLRICIVCYLFSAWYFPPFKQIPTALKIAYEHQTPHVSSIMRMLSSNTAESLMRSEKDLEQGITEFKTYFNEYQGKYGFNYAYERLVWEYSVVSVVILDEAQEKTTKDSVRFRTALSAAREMNSIFRLFEYKSLPEDFGDGFLVDLCELESRVLLAMKKDEEAIQSLQSILEYDAPEYLKTALLKRISELRSQ